MPSLRDYRDRIASVKSTKKITSAMKMVAASKLKKAQLQAEASQPYATAMAEMLSRVAANIVVGANLPKLLTGTGAYHAHLLVVVSSDRGLCGGFNGNLVRKTRGLIADLHKDGREVKIITVGRKARDLLNRTNKDEIIKSFTGIGSSGRVEFDEAHEISEYIQDLFSANEFDICTLVYNDFASVLSQVPTPQQIIPFKLPEAAEENKAVGPKPVYIFEPEEEKILADLLPRNLSIQIFRALLDSAAGEQAARMTAMDNATRNAGDRINDLTLQYNRARQAYITKELIEIISGAEAL